jgi:hypothetical protein
MPKDFLMGRVSVICWMEYICNEKQCVLERFGKMLEMSDKVAEDRLQTILKV